MAKRKKGNRQPSATQQSEPTAPPQPKAQAQAQPEPQAQPEHKKLPKAEEQPQAKQAQPENGSPPRNDVGPDPTSAGCRILLQTAEIELLLKVCEKYRSTLPRHLLSSKEQTAIADELLQKLRSAHSS